jgi:hypothetical protein
MPARPIIRNSGDSIGAGATQGSLVEQLGSLQSINPLRLLSIRSEHSAVPTSAVGVMVGVAVEVPVAVAVAVTVGVLVAGPAVLVEVAVEVLVAVWVEVDVEVLVAVWVEVDVDVLVEVWVEVDVEVLVEVWVEVDVGAGPATARPGRCKVCNPALATAVSSTSAKTRDGALDATGVLGPDFIVLGPLAAYTQVRPLYVNYESTMKARPGLWTDRDPSVGLRQLQDAKRCRR